MCLKSHVLPHEELNLNITLHVCNYPIKTLSVKQLHLNYDIGASVRVFTDKMNDLTTLNVARLYWLHVTSYMFFH